MRAHPKSVLLASFTLALVSMPAGAQLGPVQTLVSGALVAQSDNPQSAEIGRVVGIICPSGTIITDADLQARCNDVVVTALGGAGASASDVSASLLQWSTEESATQSTLSVDTASVQFGNLAARLAAIRGGGAAADSPFSRLSVFVNGDFQFGDKDATPLESGFDYDSKGVTLGADYRLGESGVIGLALGYTDQDADIDNNGGDIDAENYSVSLYGSFYPSANTYIDGIVTRGWNDYDQTRNIRYSLPAAFAAVPAVSNSAISSTDGDSTSFSLSGGYNFSRAAWTFGPYGRIEYINSDIDGFNETMSAPSAPGSGLALQIDDQSVDSFTLAVGGQASYAISQSWGVLVPFASLEYVHEFQNDDNRITGRFLGDGSGTSFTLALDDGDTNYFNVGAGLSAVFAQGRSAFVAYRGLIGYEDLSVHTITAGLRLEF